MKTIVEFLGGTPPDEKITACLVEMAKISNKAAQELVESNGRNLERMNAYVAEADQVEERIHELLDNAFQLCFFDKRDVDHVTRTLNKLVHRLRRISLHLSVCAEMAPEGIPKDCEKFVAIIKRMTETLTTMVNMLSSRHLPLDEVNLLMDSLQRDEVDANLLRIEARRALFTEYYPNGNAIEYGERKDLYAKLEQVTDEACLCGKHILSIARK